MGKLFAKSDMARAVALLSLVIVGGSKAGAADLVTDTYMATAMTIPAAAAGAGGIAYVSPPVVRPAVHAGVVSAVGTGTITDDNASWASDQFNGASGSHYVEFPNGAISDIVRTDSQTRTLSLADALPGTVGPNTPYLIRPHLTLSSIFGYFNQAGLLAGQNVTAADNILLHNAQTQSTLTYFYANVTGYAGWYRSDYASAPGTPIRPEQGMIVRHKTAVPLVLFWDGVSKSTATRVPVFGGYNLVGTLRGVRSLTLNQLNLVTGDPATGFAPGNSPAAGDNLVVVLPDLTTATYFYSDYSGFTGWFNATYAASGTVGIPPGTAFFINRKTPRPAFYWNIPAE